MFINKPFTTTLTLVLGLLISACSDSKKQAPVDATVSDAKVDTVTAVFNHFRYEGRDTIFAHNDAPEGEALYEGHRAIWLWEFDLTNKKVLADSGHMIIDGGVDLSKQPIWIEAPHNVHKYCISTHWELCLAIQPV